jgi:hypothetical protein
MITPLRVSAQAGKRSSNRLGAQEVRNGWC